MRKQSAIIVVGLAGLLNACGGGSGGSDPGGPTPEELVKTPPAKLALETFSADCGDFLDYAADALSEQFLTQYYCFADGPCPVFAATPEFTDGDTAVTGGAAPDPQPDRVSTTNTQESGVDEADVVRADAAGRLYVLSGRQLHVLEAFPPQGLEQRAVTSIDVGGDDPAFYATDFYLDPEAGSLVVLGGSYADNRARAVAVIYGLQDPLAPVEQARLSVDGYALQTRRIGARIHRVSRFDVPTPDWFYDGGDALADLRQRYFEARGAGDGAAADALKVQVRAEIARRVQAAGAAPFLPTLSRQFAGQSEQRQQLACDAISHPEVTTAMGLALIDSFNTDASRHAISAIVNNAYQVYASEANLYLMQSSFGWFFAPEQADQTAIYRLALSADGPVAYRALGLVDGSLGNAYQASEYAGALRVATTERGREGGPYNHVTILDATGDGTMAQLGAVRDLAPGETVQGARFVGPRGFVVTYRQVDPLFALDLSDPRQPRVADTLKIPGFSSYLMPLGDDYLLTIGRAGTDEQLTGEVAIQLFDVRNLDSIQQRAVITPGTGDAGYSYSAAEYDPHAFSYFPDAAAATPGTLAVPLQAYGKDAAGNDFAGFMVVRVAPDSGSPLLETGRIDHTALAAGNDACATPNGAERPPCRDLVYAAQPRRSVFMQDGAGTYLYTISAVGVIASDALQPDVTLGSRGLPYDPPCCYLATDATPGGSP